MSRWLFAIVLSGAGIVLPATQIPTAQAVIDDPEAYAVYATLIGWENHTAKAKPLVIQRETATNNWCTLSGAALEGDWKPVVEDFKRQNAPVRFLAPDRDLEVPYIVVPVKDIRAFFKQGGGDWQAFYRRYPDSGGYVEVSAVGFNQAKTRALAYMAHHCGGLCGSGTHYLLEKVNGAWREAKVAGVSTCGWVS
jgi:hypothetical protein